MEFKQLNLDCMNINDDDLKAPVFINYDICQNRFKDQAIFGKSIKEELKETNSKIDSYIKLNNYTIKCKRCKHTNVNINIIQTRKTDESSTIVYSCNSCGFKQYNN
ncbi:hypothetical protein H8356DRAFT_949085 [Neocallimastix lanati (nom. inval.)]|nr:hypothetical protein H8356DRAFT_949085 [Neocallimastix sp. JGI-2020a]